MITPFSREHPRDESCFYNLGQLGMDLGHLRKLSLLRRNEYQPRPAVTVLARDITC